MTCKRSLMTIISSIKPNQVINRLYNAGSLYMKILIMISI